MIRRLLASLFRPSAEIRQEATTLITVHGPQRAWLIARDKCRLAEVVDAEGDARHWIAVRREIEQQTGYVHQADTATGVGER